MPTLVLHARDDQFCRVGNGRYLAEHIDGARYVELDTAEHVPWASSADITGEIEEFLTGTRQMAPSDRLLATVLFSDIVGSTEQATALGDKAWTARLEQHDRAVDRQLARFGGHLVKRTGDGVLATFDGPARAVQCAVAMRDALRQLGIGVRVGVHTGRSSGVVTTWRASRCTSPNACRPRRRAEKCWCPGPSSTSWSGRTSGSWTAASTSSRGCRGSGGSSPSEIEGPRRGGVSARLPGGQPGNCEATSSPPMSLPVSPMSK